MGKRVKRKEEKVKWEGKEVLKEELEEMMEIFSREDCNAVDFMKAFESIYFSLLGMMITSFFEKEEWISCLDEHLKSLRIEMEEELATYEEAIDLREEIEEYESTVDRPLPEVDITPKKGDKDN